MPADSETKPNEFDQRCLARPPRADNNIQPRCQLQIKPVEKAFLNLHAFDIQGNLVDSETTGNFDFTSG